MNVFPATVCLVLLLTGCATSVCRAALCPNGCCDDQGLCQLGTESGSCGGGGDACAVCQAPLACKANARVCKSVKKPDVMFLVDISGSMNLPMDPTLPACPTGCYGSSCPPECPTRLRAVQRDLYGFLGSHNTDARYGLALFPRAGATQCEGPTSPSVSLASSNDDPTELGRKAVDVASTLMALSSGAGGSPTGDGLQLLGSYPPLHDADRDDYVLLITDGVPYCNASNPNTCANPSACQCALSTSCSGVFCALGCVDGTVSATAASMRDGKGIRTIVIGVGPDVVSGAAAAALEELAVAGGFEPTCPEGTDAECGDNNTCVVATKKCAKKHLEAQKSRLNSTLGRIAAQW